MGLGEKENQCSVMTEAMMLQRGQEEPAARRHRAGGEEFSRTDVEAMDGWSREMSTARAPEFPQVAVRRG